MPVIITSIVFANGGKRPPTHSLPAFLMLETVIRALQTLGLGRFGTRASDPGTPNPGTLQTFDPKWFCMTFLHRSATAQCAHCSERGEGGASGMELWLGS